MRQLASEYDGTSNFAGFAGKRIDQRLIDEHRVEGRRGSLHADQFSDATPIDGHESQPDDPRDAKVAQEYRESASLMFESLNSSDMFDVLLPHLSERQRQIIELRRRAEMNDRDVAMKCGVTRETVNREMKKIKGIAKKLGPLKDS